LLGRHPTVLSHGHAARCDGFGLARHFGAKGLTSTGDTRLCIDRELGQPLIDEIRPKIKDSNTKALALLEIDFSNLTVSPDTTGLGI